MFLNTFSRDSSVTEFDKLLQILTTFLWKCWRLCQLTIRFMLLLIVA